MKTQGERLRIPAQDWNDVRELALNATRRLDAPAAHDQRPAGLVLVRNDSGGAADRFDVLGIDEPVFDPSTALGQFKQRVLLSCITPAAGHAGKFVVLYEPLADGQIGWAWASEVCAVQISVADATAYRLADVVAGQNYLAGSWTGSAAILWQETGTGTKWAIVRLGNPPWTSTEACA